MKKLILIGFLFIFISIAVAQQRAVLPGYYKDITVQAVYTPPTDNVIHFNVPPNQTTNANYVREWPPNEHQIGMSYYDLWSNTMIENRFYRWDDGTMAAVWIYGEEATSFPDRGTGYNYYDGTEWDPIPEERLESLRTGWPSYAPLGDNGEIVVSHDYGAYVLYILTRTEKGVGEWTETAYTYSSGPPELSWARLITGGADFNIVHMVANSVDPYMGQNAAVVYSRSVDGGITWDMENIIIEGMGIDYYLDIGADAYVLAARDNTVAILVGGAWNDLFMMKSTDNGDTWDKTVIWEHPYPFFDWNTTIADTLFACDNSAQITIDYDGMAHVVFGITRVAHWEVGGSYNYYPFVDGIGYWNEDMPTFSNDLNALAPPQYGYVNSEMVEDYNYIGWMQDVDGDGEIHLNGWPNTTVDNILSYRELGPSTMPTITVNEFGQRFVLFASTTETYENGQVNYKHIWARAYANGIWGEFLDLSGDIVHIFDECIYPQLSSITDDYIHYFYMCDVTPGLALDDDHPYQENMFMYASLPIPELIGIEEKVVLSEDNVSQNYPNPFDKTSIINVTLDEPADISLEVTTITGQKVYEMNFGKMNKGTQTITIDARNLKPGVYFYTVRFGNQAVTKQMIVE